MKEYIDISDDISSLLREFGRITSLIRYLPKDESSIGDVAKLIKEAVALLNGSLIEFESRKLSNDEEFLLRGDSDEYSGGWYKFSFNIKFFSNQYLSSIVKALKDFNDPTATGNETIIECLDASDIMMMVEVCSLALDCSPKIADLDKELLLVKEKILNLKASINKEIYYGEVVFFEYGIHNGLYITLDKSDHVFSSRLSFGWRGDNRKDGEIFFKNIFRMFDWSEEENINLEVENKNIVWHSIDIEIKNFEDDVIELRNSCFDPIRSNVSLKISHASINSISLSFSCLGWDVFSFGVVDLNKDITCNKLPLNDIALNIVSSDIHEKYRKNLSYLFHNQNIKSYSSGYDDISKCSNLYLLIYDRYNKPNKKQRNLKKSLKREGKIIFEWFIEDQYLHEVKIAERFENNLQFNKKFTFPEVVEPVWGVIKLEYVVEFILRTAISNKLEHPILNNAKALCYLGNSIAKSYTPPLKKNIVYRKRIYKLLENEKKRLLVQNIIDNNYLVADENNFSPYAEIVTFNNDASLKIKGLRVYYYKGVKIRSEISLSTRREIDKGNVVISNSGVGDMDRIFKILLYKKDEIILSLKNIDFFSKYQIGDKIPLRSDIKISKHISDKTNVVNSPQLEAINNLMSGDFSAIAKSLIGLSKLSETHRKNKRNWIILKNENILDDHEQMSFLYNALNGKNVELYEGPVGTGKSTVLAEAIYQQFIFGKDQGSPIFITAQTNKAVDGVLIKLKYKYGLPIRRVGKKEYDSPRYHPDLESSLYNGPINHRETDRLLRGNIIVGGTMYGLSTVEGYFDSDKSIKHRLVDKLRKISSKLYIDEFGVASIGETFSVMRLANDKLFSIGDSRQLGVIPLDNSLKSAMDLHFGMSEQQIKSVENSFYKYIVRQNIFKHDSLKKVYRLTPTLVKLVDIHYQKELSDPFLISANKDNISRILDSHSYLLIDTSLLCSKEISNQQKPDDSSKDLESNLPHAKLVSKIVCDILNNSEFTYKDIGIITPYNRQIDLYKEVFEKIQHKSLKIEEVIQNYNSVIGSVYPFQGDERPITVVDLVRYDAIFGPFSGGTGFISKEMLLVMMSRSLKGPLILVANMETFRRSKKQAVNNIMNHALSLAKSSYQSYIEVESISDIDLSNYINIWDGIMKCTGGVSNEVY